MDWWPVQGVFRTRPQCTRIQRDPHQEQRLLKMNEWKYILFITEADEGRYWQAAEENEKHLWSEQGRRGKLWLMLLGLGARWGEAGSTAVRGKGERRKPWFKGQHSGGLCKRSSLENWHAQHSASVWQDYSCLQTSLVQALSLSPAPLFPPPLHTNTGEHENQNTASTRIS